MISPTHSGEDGRSRARLRFLLEGEGGFKRDAEQENNVLLVSEPVLHPHCGRSASDLSLRRGGRKSLRKRGEECVLIINWH